MAKWCAADPGPLRTRPVAVPDQRRTTRARGSACVKCAGSLACARAAPRPGHACELILDVGAAEFLDSLAGVDLGGEDVALAVDGDVVQRRELADLAAGPAAAAARLARGVVADAPLAVHAVDHVDELLLGVGREHEVVDRAGAARRLLVDLLGDEAAVLVKDLQAVVDAVADEDEPVLVDADAVHGVAELLRRRLCRIVRRGLRVARLVAVGPPVALVGAGLGIDPRHAAVAGAVGREPFLGGDVDRDVGGGAEPLLPLPASQTKQGPRRASATGCPARGRADPSTNVARAARKLH